MLVACQDEGRMNVGARQRRIPGQIVRCDHLNGIAPAEKSDLWREVGKRGCNLWRVSLHRILIVEIPGGIADVSRRVDLERLRKEMVVGSGLVSGYLAFARI